MIDTPGILDHPLEERNTIEMQAITALAHLNAAILFFCDISEECGYTIEAQLSLFKSVTPLFSSKPIVIVLSKSDLQLFNKLSKKDQEAIQNTAEKYNATVIQMSNKSGDGITDVKTKACDILLDFRLIQKKDVKGLENRIQIVTPKKVDGKARPAAIPDSVTMGATLGRKTAKELENEKGGPGVFDFAIEEHYMLENEDWKFDQWPTFFDGKNVADFYDADIQTKLDELEKEEEEILAMEAEEMIEETDDLEERMKHSLKEVRGKRNIIREKSMLKKKLRIHQKTIKASKLEEGLTSKNIDPTGALTRGKEKVNPISDFDPELQRGRKRRRSADLGETMMDIDEDELKSKILKRRAGSEKLSRTMSNSRREGSAPPATINRIKTEESERLRKKIERKFRGIVNICDADRKVTESKPKHLFSGKRKKGKTDYR